MPWHLDTKDHKSTSPWHEQHQEHYFTGLNRFDILVFAAYSQVQTSWEVRLEEHGVSEPETDVEAEEEQGEEPVGGEAKSPDKLPAVHFNHTWKKKTEKHFCWSHVDTNH